MFATSALSQGSPAAEDSTFDPFAPTESTDRPFVPVAYGVMTDYEYSATHKRQRLTIWSGPFYSVFEGEAHSRPKGWTIRLDYIPEALHVDGPSVRNDENYQEVDKLLADAVNEFVKSKGFVSL